MFKAFVYISCNSAQMLHNFFIFALSVGPCGVFTKDFASHNTQLPDCVVRWCSVLKVMSYSKIIFSKYSCCEKVYQCVIRQFGNITKRNFSNQMAHKSMLPQSLQLCRLMHPQDANIGGNVHGGTILKMIEDAGTIASTRYCNSNQELKSTSDGQLCVLARVESTDFCQPMYVGEVASLNAEITFTSNHSLEVKIDVTAENIILATKRLTNRATLWYVPVYEKNRIGNVPKLVYANTSAEMAGQERYNKQKQERKVKTHPESGEWKDFDNFSLNTDSSKKFTVEFAQSSLIHMVNVGDCGFHGNVTGGVTMKMMDEVAGICAARHCQSGSVVTASMDAMDLHQPIYKGSIMHLKSRPTFCSNKSMEIQVVVDVERVFKKNDNTIETEIYRACSAFFTYVALGPKPERKVLPVPPLNLQNEAEKQRFAQGEARYLLRKQNRIQK